MPEEKREKNYDSNLSPEQDTMLDIMLARYIPNVTGDERAALREAVDKFTTTATGQAYIFGWDAGRKDSWISVTSHLPEPFALCAVALPTPDGFGTVECGYLLDGEGWKIQGKYVAVRGDVTQWQPMPDAPRTNGTLDTR